MNQKKIGNFISNCRKRENYTQKQLADKLGITDRAVSKWETGKSLPDASIMIELCNILKITVNDLLSGEVVTMDNYNKEMENKLLEMVKQKEESDKRLLTLEWVIGILSLIILFTPIFIASYLPMEEWQRIVILFSGFIPCFIGFFFAVKIEQVAGYYECQHCKHKYVPKLHSVWFSMHVGRTRYMKCPKCNKKSWQKKIISKD